MGFGVTEFSFYALKNTTIEKTLPKLLEKIYNSGFKVHILCQDDEQLKTLDSTIWTFSSNAFVPHGSIFDAPHTYPDHPIFLSTSETIVNNATIFLSLKPVLVKDFNKVIYFFDLYKDNASEFEKIYVSLKSEKPTYWQQTENGGWEKK